MDSSAELAEKTAESNRRLDLMNTLDAELEASRKREAAALAACKVKDEALYTCEVGDYSTGCVVPPSFDERKVEEALAIQPDDIVEMDWRLK